MIAITDAENLQPYKGKFSLIVEQILAFGWRYNMVREVKTCSKFQTNCMAIFYVIKYCHLDSLRSVLLLNSKRLHQKLACI